MSRSFRPQAAFFSFLLVAACAAPPQAPDYEVWLVDQSDTRGQSHGGTLYIFDGADLSAADVSSVAPRERIDLAGDVAEMCMASTEANPVRPHMLLFNRDHTHGVLSFVASGHVVVFDAATRAPLACLRTTRSETGQQAHAAVPSSDGSFILVANQNGKRLERIDADFAANTFTLNEAAALDLAACTTPSGAPCQAPELRPDNAPICPIMDPGGTHAFVTLRGGGLLVVDPRATPMRIVGEYDMATVKGNGCGGVEAAGAMYLNSGGRPGPMEHLSMYGFDVYRFPLDGYGGASNEPAPQVVFSAPGEHDSHGMVAVGAEPFVWVMDRNANVAEIISPASGQRVHSVPLAGELSADPAPDLVDASPSGDRLFVALRGSTPLSGDPHIATGTTPGLGVIEVTEDGRNGRLAGIIRISNTDDAGADKADAHAVRVRRR